MGLLSGIKDTYKKTEAAVVVQNLLDLSARAGLFEGDTSLVARTVVDAAWKHKPDIFSGKFGQRPHKIAVAGFALGLAVTRLDDSSNLKSILVIALGNLLSEAATNRLMYGFSSMDDVLFEAAAKAFPADAVGWC